MKEAEKLRERVDSLLDVEPDAPASKVVRAIVDELGITEEMLYAINGCTAAWVIYEEGDDTRTADLATAAADALATLLEASRDES